jgi:PTS system nitrogen regulatory IIA component
MQATSSYKLPVALSAIFPPQAIVIGLKERTKEGVVSEMVRHLVGLGILAENNVEAVVGSILAREKLGTTALYEGVAFPHCRTSCTEEFVGVLGIDSEGIAFDAVGGGAVHSIFLFLAPLDRRDELYEVLGRITAIGRDKSRRVQFRGCRNPEAAHQLLLELDRQ